MSEASQAPAASPLRAASAVGERSIPPVLPEASPNRGILPVVLPGDRVVPVVRDVGALAHVVARETDYAVASRSGLVWARADVVAAPQGWTDVCYRCGSA